MTQPRLVALLCYLVLARPRGLHARDTLIALLWPEHDESRGRQALRNALHSLRRQLGQTTIVSAGDQLVGLDATVMSCDALDLERGVLSRDRASVVSSDIEPFQGMHVRDAPAFDQWLSNERERLRTLLRRRAQSSTVIPESPPPARHPYSPDAWVLHARGHYLFLRTAHGGPADDLLRSREYFERARALDPTFAPALAGLANFYAVAARRCMLTPFHDHFAHAIRLSEQALALDAALAVPHVHFGVKALYIDDDFARAGTEFTTAVAKDSAYAEGHRFLGVWLGMAGRYAESVQAMEQAVALEPDIAHLLSSLAVTRLASGDRIGAEEALRRTLLLEPRHGLARERLIHLLEGDGRLAEAVAERERAPARADAGIYRAALAESEHAYRRLVQQALAQEAEALTVRVQNPDATCVDDLFAPPVVRLVQLYARAGDWRRVSRWRLQAQSRRPALSRWFDALPELAQRERVPL